MEMLDKKDLYEMAVKNGADAHALTDFETEFGIEEIQKIIASCSNIDEACRKLSEKFPLLKYEELKKQFDEYVKKAREIAADAESEKVVELAEDELEAVAGGSFGSWLKENWAGLALGAAVAIGCSAMGRPLIGAIAGSSVAILVNTSVKKKETPADAPKDSSPGFQDANEPV